MAVITWDMSYFLKTTVLCQRKLKLVETRAKFIAMKSLLEDKITEVLSFFS